MNKLFLLLLALIPAALTFMGAELGPNSDARPGWDPNGSDAGPGWDPDGLNVGPGWDPNGTDTDLG
jgi:hypothetical protein